MQERSKFTDEGQSLLSKAPFHFSQFCSDSKELSKALSITTVIHIILEQHFRNTIKTTVSSTLRMGCSHCLFFFF